MIPNHEQNQTEEYDMSGTVGTDTAGILALLADTSRAGRGNFYGGGEGGNGGFGPWAGPASNAARIESVGKTVGLEANCINGTLESLTRTLASDATNKNISDANGRICDRLSAMEAQSARDLLQVTRDQNDARAEAAKCCCDIQLQAANDKAELKSEIKDLEVSRLKDELAKARDANNISATVQQTIAAMKQCGCCGSSHHGHHG